MPSSVAGVAGNSGCCGSLYRLIRSLNIASPRRVLPSFAENALRPSSAVRASKAASEESDQVRDRLRFKNHRIVAGFDRLRLSRSDRLADGLFGDLLRIETRRIEVIAGEVTGSSAIGGARRHAQVGAARAEVAAIPVRGCRCGRRAASGVKSGAGHLRRTACLENALQRFRARGDVDVGRRPRRSRDRRCTPAVPASAHTRAAPATRARFAPHRPRSV